MKRPVLTDFIKPYSIDGEAFIEYATALNTFADYLEDAHSKSIQQPDWNEFANALKDRFGESLVEGESSEDDSYNWWLSDVTVLDITEFCKAHFNEKKSTLNQQ